LKNHADLMGFALEEAELARGEGEIPIGAVLVRGGQVLAQDHNRRASSGDATAHAEVLVIREAGKALGDWRLSGATLYVTLEPCPMCAGAIVLARVDTVVYGASDPQAGAGGSAYNILQDGRLNHRVEVIGGIMEEECRRLLQGFFDGRR